MNKPEILVALYAYHPFANANTNVILPLIKKLSEKYDVNIVTQNNNNSEPDFEVIDGIKVYRYKRQNGILRYIYILNKIDADKKRVFWKKALVSFLKPIAQCLYKLDMFKHSEYRLIKRLLGEKSFQCVISTCASFFSHYNVLELKKDPKFEFVWISCFMDPYAYFVGNLSAGSCLIEQEKEVYEKSDLVLVTEEIYNENHTNDFKPYLYKTVPMKFGNFRCIHNELLKDIFVTGKINCAYVGSLLDERIRSPRYLYKLINEVDDRFVFHIICNRMTEDNKKLRDSILEKNERVRWYNNLPFDECMGIISNADALINLGNRAINQTPSKVFDYIGTGRPIINLYSLENDTSKGYLEKYPNKLNIFEDDNKITENAQIFMKFLDNNVGKTVPDDELKELYKGYLSEYVTEKTAQSVIEVIESK